MVYKYLSGVCNCGQFVAFGGPLRGTAAQLADLADASGEALADFAAGHFENVSTAKRMHCCCEHENKIVYFYLIGGVNRECVITTVKRMNDMNIRWRIQFGPYRRILINYTFHHI